MTVKVLLGLVTLLYPLAVYTGLQTFEAQQLIVLLVLLAGLRLLVQGDNPMNHWLWLPILALMALATWITGSDLGLKLYPVLVNLSLLTLFGWSLKFPPSAVERMARLREPDLPDAAIRYTRKVTQVWCAFFCINGTMALLTSLWASTEVWALYNGLIAYLLMALLFAGEWLVRQRVQRRASGNSL
ncbi:hypothetical protein HBA55_31795 [Pseudomaricurvus alkylphenolicus]|nr:hypothetical protein [Pseudomaricurvus alkylphenolicus]